MPHVIVKMFEGRTQEQKQAVADAVTQAMMTALGCKESSVSVAIEDFKTDEWMENVYAPDIQARAQTIYKKPGYGPES